MLNSLTNLLFSLQIFFLNRLLKNFFRVYKVAIICLFVLILSIQSYPQINSQSAFRGNFIPRSAFRQEIARLEITVEREGHIPLPMTMVPRVGRGDLIRVRMLEEPINGIKPDQSFWNWTLVVAFVNPSRNKRNEDSVSREIHFKRDGWYREHLFRVPYDSQPVFFLYPKSKYRKKIKKLINKNFSQIRKIGEKTLEIAGAYAQIGMFLNELQKATNRDQNGFGGFNNFNFGRNNRSGDTFFRNEMIERLAQSFNIRLPNCWSQSSFGFNSNNFINRAQCVAKNVRLEDFDVSVGKMIQQGGLFAATRLVEKFPMLAYWINVAAAAIDFILKATRQSPLRIVPTMAQTRNSNQQYNYNNNSNSQNQIRLPPSQKISLYAEKSPSDLDYVTAFPIVLHKWQAEPAPEVISLPIPSLLEPCLHVGRNILRNTDLSYDWIRDPFTRDFRLIMTSENGFSKEFYLTKNLGISGWQLMLNAQDLRAFPKVKMKVETKIVAVRGFSKIESPAFVMPISGGGKWEITTDSARAFSVGGRRRVTIRNTVGSTRCLQSVKYKPAFGGEFTFNANARANPLRFNELGTEAWLDIDTTDFQAGRGTLEFRAYGTSQPQNIPIKLYAGPPKIRKLEVHKGDRKVTIEGNGVSQIKMLNVNGKMARPPNPKQNNKQPNNKKVFVFQNPTDIILSKTVSIEVHLEGNRAYKYPEPFSVLPARPAIEANKQNEIKAAIVDNVSTTINRFNLSRYPIVSINTKGLTVAVKTILTDYVFRAENIRIETRIENGQVGQGAMPRAVVEVLDQFNLRIGFEINQQGKQFLAGRRLQFRIKDAERGNSDWYTIKQIFVRTPRINSLQCKNRQCKITGKGLDYIGQISVDGGKVWQRPSHVQPAPNGNSTMMIPGVKDKKLLRIKLRDFPKMKGLLLN